jgi:hypothetical protein
MTKSKSTGAKVFPPKVTDQRSSVGKRNKISTGVEASMLVEPKERKNGNLQTIDVFSFVSSRSFLIGFRAMSLRTFAPQLGIWENSTIRGQILSQMWTKPPFSLLTNNSLPVISHKP